MNFSKARKSLRRKAAFTLFEMIIVLTIMALLAGFVIFNLQGFTGIGKETKARQDIIGLKEALTLYNLENRALPTSEQGLNALVSRPTTEPVPTHWKQTLTSLELDPWGNPYQYQRPGTHNPDSFDVFSTGPDGKSDTDDDIGNWK